MCTNEVYRNHVLDLRNFLCAGCKLKFSRNAATNPTCCSHFRQVLRKNNSFLVSRVETAINVARSMRMLPRMLQKRCSIISIRTTICQHYQQLLLKFHITLGFRMSKITANVNGSMHSHKRILQKHVFFFQTLLCSMPFWEKVVANYNFQDSPIKTYDLSILPTMFRNMFLRNCFFKSVIQSMLHDQCVCSKECCKQIGDDGSVLFA